MKTYRYCVEVMINKPIDLVTKTIIDYTMMTKWQTYLTLVKPIQGEPGTKGSITELTYTIDKQEMTMTETIVLNEMPHLFVVIYEHQNTWNKCINHFIKDEDKTRWIMDSEFRTDLENISKQAFINKTKQSMTIFKTFVES